MTTFLPTDAAIMRKLIPKGQQRVMNAFQSIISCQVAALPTATGLLVNGSRLSFQRF